MSDLEFKNVVEDEATVFCRRLVGIMVGEATPFDGAFALGVYTGENGALRVTASWRGNDGLQGLAYEAVANRLETLAAEIRKGRPEAKATVEEVS